MTESRIEKAAALQLIQEGRKRSLEFQSIKIEKIIEVLHGVGNVWAEGSPYFVKALEVLSRELNFSKESIYQTLLLVPSLCDSAASVARIKAELGGLEALNDFVPTKTDGLFVKAQSRGVILHVAAGNVFLGCIDSLVNGFLTKSYSIVKLSERNHEFPALFADSISAVDTEGILKDKYKLVFWDRADKETEFAFKQNVDAIIAWGGESMVNSYRKDRGLQTQMIEHGPKISFQVVFADAFKERKFAEVARQAVIDVATFDQSACSSAQVLFLQDEVDQAAFGEALVTAFKKFPIAAGKMTEDDAVERLKELARGEYNEFILGGKLVSGSNFMLHFDPSPGLRLSPLNRSLIIKKFSNLKDLESQISPFKSYLQCCGVAGSIEAQKQLASLASQWGVTRVCGVGQMTSGKLGAPHDGEYLLRELLKWTTYER
ncbi:MAG: acyl-CoA reductase [Bdellovibrionota bacterium]